MAVVGVLVPVGQGLWVRSADARGWLPGDGAAVVATLAMLAAPGVVAAVLAWRWPRIGGAAAGLWALPWLLWFADPHLEREALWVVAAVVLVGLAAWGARRPSVGFAVLALAGAGAGGWPVQGQTAKDAVGNGVECAVVGESVGEGAPTIVLVTLDTVRADHLGAIGGARFQAPTPHLDGLVGRGTLFTEGVAPAPLTGPAHTAMLTGCDPLSLGVLRNGVAVPSGASAVAATLHARGYRTGAFLGANVLDRRVGLERGFDHYDDRFDPWHRLRPTWPRRLLGRLGWVRDRRQRSGGEVVERATRWLEAGEGPTFLWVHLYDAHHPYDPEPAFVDAVVDVEPGGQGSAEDVADWAAWRKEWARVPDLPGATPRGDVARRLRAYAAEVGEVDALVGRLLQVLPEGSAVLVAADHGESLTEHGYVLNHGAHVYQATVRVPFVAVGPGFDPGARVARPTPSQRVAGTLLRWGGIDAVGLQTPYDVDEEGPIESFTTGQEARRRLRLAPRSAELAQRDGSAKYLVRQGQSWRFDLDVDPEERHPIAVPPEGRRARLLEIDEGGSPVVEGLEALGYVD